MYIYREQFIAAMFLFGQHPRTPLYLFPEKDAAAVTLANSFNGSDHNIHFAKASASTPRIISSAPVNVNMPSQNGVSNALR